MRNDFDDWNEQKKSLHREERDILFHEGEIWWCHIGLNVGFEFYGKGKEFWRPVLVLKKHNRMSFFGLPLGSTVKNHPFYYPFDWHGRDGCIRLDQGRIFSTKRLSNRMGKVTTLQLAQIKAAYRASI